MTKSESIKDLIIRDLTAKLQSSFENSFQIDSRLAAPLKNGGHPVRYVVMRHRTNKETDWQYVELLGKHGEWVIQDEVYRAKREKEFYFKSQELARKAKAKWIARMVKI